LNLRIRQPSVGFIGLFLRRERLREIRIHGTAGLSHGVRVQRAVALGSKEKSVYNKNTVLEHQTLLANVERAMELLQHQGPGALESALGLLQQTVFSFSMKICGHHEDAEDTMQDVLLKAVPYLPKFTSPKALGVWLYTVAKNRCLMSRRRSKFAPRENLSLEELIPDRRELAQAEDRSPEQSVLRDENAEKVRQAVLRIPPLYRLILVLHDMEELPTEEIARITGLREGTVRVRLHRARLFARNELARQAFFGGQAMRPGPRSKADATPRPGRCKQLFASLSDYLDGVLDDEVCEQMEQHIAGCQPCAAFIATLQKTGDQVKGTSRRKPGSSHRR
jgi:RNA polymerase sigma-70 factor (ECF subfamily)